MDPSSIARRFGAGTNFPSSHFIALVPPSTLSHFLNPPCPSPRLTGAEHMGETRMAKIVLITGANKGIGFEVARQLGRSGYTVLLGARDASRGEAAAAKLKGEGSEVRGG